MATPLMVAAGSGYGATVETLRLLLDLGADPWLNFGAGTAARFAVEGLTWGYEPGGDAERLEAGADPHATTELGWNAFHAAIDADGAASREESVRSTFELLASLGVDINHRANGGGTPLSRAGHCGTKIEVRVLLELGAKEDALHHS
jgi:ankyrin repeat protein